MKLITKLFIVLFILGSFQTARAVWRKKNVNTLAWLRTVYFVDADTGWIGGSRGTLLTTKDGGKTWKQSRKFTEDTILEVFFSDKNTGWLLCERNIYNLGSKAPSYLLKTADGGENWEKIEFDNAQRRRITKIFFSKNGFGMAVGEMGTLFGLQDDNHTWKKLDAPSDYLIRDGAFADDLNGTLVGGGGTILFTNDGGVSWKPAFVSSKPKTKLNSVFFLNKTKGWTVGSNGKIYQTFNGGKFWRLQRSKTLKNLNDVFFINSAEGWAVGNDGMILHTQTAGNVWVKDRAVSRHKLERIYFNNKKGWIVGFGGTVLSYDLRGFSNAKRPTFRNK